MEFGFRNAELGRHGENMTSAERQKRRSCEGKEKD